MENLIAIEGREKEQFANLEDLVKRIINVNYYEMTREEKKIELEKKAFANTMLRKIDIIKNVNEINNIEDDIFVIVDEFTFILSLLKMDKIVLLEKTNANIFGKYIDKSQIKDNYLILNAFANEILKKYLEN